MNFLFCFVKGKNTCNIKFSNLIEIKIDIDKIKIINQILIYIYTDDNIYTDNTFKFNKFCRLHKI
jgi:hypothetical protein